jgi:hypothetical protein
MVDTPNWQFAPDLYKYIVGTLEKALNSKLNNDTESAYLCYVDIYNTLQYIIKQKDKELWDRITAAKEACNKAKQKLYFYNFQGGESPSNIKKIAVAIHEFESNISVFHETLFQGAYISNLMIPVTKDSGKLPIFNTN